MKHFSRGLDGVVARVMLVTLLAPTVIAQPAAAPAETARGLAASVAEVEDAVAAGRQPAWVAHLGRVYAEWIDAQRSDPGAVAALLRRFHGHADWDDARALREADALTDRMEAEAAAWLTGAARADRPYPDAPTPDWTRMRLADGRFRIDGEAVFPLGFSWYDEVEFADYHVGGDPEPFADTLGPIVAQLRPIGAGLHEINVRVSSLLHEDEARNQETARWIRRRLDLYAQHGVVGNINLIWNHTRPLEDRYPGVTDSAWHFFRMDIDHPAFKPLAQQAMDTLLSEIAEHPALAAFCLANEPEFPVEGWTAHTHRGLDRWLAQGLDALVNPPLSGATQAALREIRAMGEPTPERITEASADARALLRGFNQRRAAEMFVHLADAIRAHDPGVPIHIKIQDLSSVAPGEHHADNGIDRRLLAGVTDLSGIDTRLLPVTDRRAAARSWRPDRYVIQWTHAMLAYDQLRTIAPDQPVFDSEMHAFSTSALRIADTEPAHARAAMWLMALHGSTGNIVWYWQRRDHPEVRHPALSHAFAGSLTTRPALLGELFRANAELNEFAACVEALAQAERRVAVLFSSATRLADPEHLHALHTTYEALAQLGFAVAVPDEAAWRASRAEGAAVLVLPAVSRLDLGTLGAGADGNSEPDPSVLIAVDRPRVIRDEGGTILAEDATLRDGWIELQSADDALNLHQRLHAALEARKIDPAIRLLDADGEPGFGTVYRSAPDPALADRMLTGLVHVLAEPVTRRVVDDAGRARRGVDLLSGQRIDGANLRLEPYDVRLIRWDAP